VEAQVIASRDEAGEAYLLTGVTRDITERHLMEQQLKESNERYDLVAQATSDVLWDWDIKTNTNWFNENITFQFGHERLRNHLEDWEGKIHPDDKSSVLQSIKQAIQEGRTHWQAEYRFIKSDGSYAMILDRGYTLYDAQKQPTRMIGAMQNITEVRNLQQTIIDEQINAQRMITEASIRSQEAEREDLGKELHDNINQILATCKMLIDVSLKNEELREEALPKSYDYINRAIEEIRVLSKSLVPPSLGDIGLSEAIDELVNIQAGCGCVKTTFLLTGDTVSCNAISADRQLVAYRIVQEQLNNIVKYAKASVVDIHLALKNKILFIMVKDDGVGFNPSEKKKGIGLRNMKSRALVYGGEVTIDSGLGKGCTLHVSIPVE
jgi:two-component system sensor histidine kinase UhpB